LLESDGDFAAGAQKANRLVQQLIKKASTGQRAQGEISSRPYYHVVYCFLKHGRTRQIIRGPRRKYIKDAANQIAAFGKTLDDLK